MWIIEFETLWNFFVKNTAPKWLLIGWESSSQDVSEVLSLASQFNGCCSISAISWGANIPFFLMILRIWSKTCPILPLFGCFGYLLMPVIDIGAVPLKSTCVSSRFIFIKKLASMLRTDFPSSPIFNNPNRMWTDVHTFHLQILLSLESFIFLFW